jgi:hypothetical protein
MYSPIIIEKTETTPEIILDKENNVFHIKGRSIIENAHEFYAPIYHWIKNYILYPNPKTEFFLDIYYLNSSSTLQLMRIFFLFEELKKKGYEIKIIWLYERDDEMSQERGDELMNAVELDFELRSYEGEFEEFAEDFSFDI